MICRIVVILLVSTACHRDRIQLRAPTPLGAQSIHPSIRTCEAPARADYDAQNLNNPDLYCLASQINNEPDAVADILSALEWNRDRAAAILTVFRQTSVNAATFYDLAALVGSQNATAAEYLLGLSNRTKDPELLAAVELARYRLARRRGDADTIEITRENITKNTRLSDAFRLSALRAFVDAKDDIGVSAICESGPGPGAAWACAEHDKNGLPASLREIAKLPMLSFKDAARLYALDETKMLSGLDCLHIEHWQFRPARLSTTNRYGKYNGQDVATIYYRLHTNAPAAEARCFLEQALRACLDLLKNDKLCPIPHVFGDFVMTLSPPEQDALIRSALRPGGWLDTTEKRYTAQGAQRQNMSMALLHLHISAAESLIKRKAKELLLLSQYHIRETGRLAKNLDVPAVELFTSSLMSRVCSPGGCASQCDPSWRDCVSVCSKIADEGLSWLCEHKMIE